MFLKKLFSECKVCLALISTNNYSIFFTDKPVFPMDHSRGNAIELIEGSQAAVNMTATANPLPIEYQWSKESTALGTHPYIT